MNLSDYIKIYDKAIDIEICQYYIDQFEASSEYWVRRQEGVFNFTEVNTVQAQWNLDPLINNIVKHRQQYWADCNISFNHVNPNHNWEELRMKRYDIHEGDEFKPHTDAWDAATARRFLVYFWYLNDVAQGGETEFYGLDRTVKVTPKAGTLIMFPATWQYLHAGLTPLSNNKYIIGGYFHHG